MAAVLWQSGGTAAWRLSNGGERFMAQYEPTMRPGQKSGVPGWLMGCGIGCGILVVAAIIGIVLMGGLAYFATRKVMEEGKGEITSELNKKYDEYVQKGLIPEENQPLFDELRDLANNEKASFPAILMCFVAIQSTFEDGEVSESELKAATDVRDYVNENPEVGFIGMGTFIGEHPELQKAFNEAQYEFGVPSEPGASEDSTEGIEEPEAMPDQSGGEPEAAPAEPGGEPEAAPEAAVPISRPIPGARVAVPSGAPAVQP